MEHLIFNGIFGEIKFTKYLAQGPDKSTAAKRQSLGHDMGFVTFIQCSFNLPTIDKCCLPEARFLLRANADRVLPRSLATPCLKPGRFKCIFCSLRF